nr:SMP-30/gluconolactonase/LRE family protein [Planctomycetota bacterium]
MPRLDRHPRLLARVRCAIGENPLWHAERGRLVFVDIPRGAVHAYEPASGRHHVLHRGPLIGGMTLQADGALLLFGAGTISLLGDDGRRRVLARGLCGPGERFNDVLADPCGRVFAGTVIED